MDQIKLAGEAGFEPTHDGVKVRCLTAWLLPKKMGWDIRVELMTSSATNWRPNQLGQSHHVLLWQKSGALWGTRTSGLLLRRQLLYPTELTAQFLERVMGIEPTRPAWKAGILPLNYTRISAFQVASVRRFNGCRFSATFVIISHSFLFVKRF